MILGIHPYTSQIVLTAAEVGDELLLLGMFVLTVTGFLMLFFQAAKLSVMTVLDRANANYWRGLIVSFCITIGLIVMDFWLLGGV